MPLTGGRNESLSAGDVFAGYTIVRLLRSRGMGEVYLAQHPRLPRRDALKVLPATVTADSEFRKRFSREADIAAELWHPHIVGSNQPATGNVSDPSQSGNGRHRGTTVGPTA